MKKTAAIVGMFGALALGGSALASGGAVLVKAGQTVTLPCNVAGAIDVAAGGRVFSGCLGRTWIGGSVDVHPGGYISVCDAHISGAFIARHAAVGSALLDSTVSGAVQNDGSVETEILLCVTTIN
jgi:hypothetical protein